VITIAQLDHSDQNTLDQLFKKWMEKLTRNNLRSVYFDLKQPLKDLGISVPPQLRSLDTVLGWPAKGVNALARRCIFDYFVLPGNESDPFEIGNFWGPNNMAAEVPQGITSSLVHSVSFITTTSGDVQSGEPDVVQSVRSARWGTGLWDRRRREFSAALSVINVNESGAPSEFVMYLPDRVLEFEALTGGRWRVFQQSNPLGRVPVRPLVFQPELDRPLGHSRITRAAMSLTDQATRVMLRTEVSAEFFSAPQRYLLGADVDAFDSGDGVKASMWKAVMGRILAISRDPDTDQLPEVGQFPQQSMEPHHSHFRNLASAFASEMNMAPASMGIITDANPASADSWAAAKEELIIEAEAANRVFGMALTKAAIDGVMLRDGLSEPTREMSQLSAKFRNPSTPSISSATDAVMKQVTAFPWMADSDVALEQLGHDEATIARLRSDRRRSQVGSLVTSIADRAAAASSEVAEAAAARGGVGESV